MLYNWYNVNATLGIYLPLLKKLTPALVNIITCVQNVWAWHPRHSVLERRYISWLCV